MSVIIENDVVRAEIEEVGAQLVSFVKKEDKTEYIWQRNPEFWASSASNLFPICGRLTEGKYTYRGEEYEMKLHGFARDLPFQVVSHTDTAVVFELKADEETLRIYPFAFDLKISYELKENTLFQTFTVQNCGEAVMPFAVGGHPGFRVPLEDGESFEDYYLEFDCVQPARKLVMSETCYFTGETIEFPMEEGKILPLRHELFDHDAIFLTDMCKEITLKSHKSNRQVHLSYPDMNYVGFWHKPLTEAPYVCIEPWYSTPAYDGKMDDLETKNEMIHLKPEDTYQNCFSISIQ